MVKLTLSIFLAVLLTAPALAYDNLDIETRAISDSNDLVSRELSEAEAIVFARDIEELFARIPEGLSQDETHEFVRRHIHVSEKVKQGWHKFVNGLKTGFQAVASVLIRRESDDQGLVFAREDAELDAREHDTHGTKNHPHAQASDELTARELQDELYERDLDEALYQREFVGWEIDELD